MTGTLAENVARDTSTKYHGVNANRQTVWRHHHVDVPRAVMPLYLTTDKIQDGGGRHFEKSN